MLERGDWIVPTFNGELRDHKPALLYWAQMVSFLSLGESEFAARLPSALCALLTAFATAVLATRLSGGRGINSHGFWAASVLGTSLLFVMAGRAATPDACLIAFSTLGIATLVIACLKPGPSRTVDKADWIAAAFGYAMLGLAALAKGPVGIVLPLAVVHTWWLVCQRLQLETEPAEDSARANSSKSAHTGIGGRLLKSFRTGWATFGPAPCFRALFALRTIPGLLLCLLVAVPWYLAVAYETNGAFLRGFFLDHNLGRAVSAMEGHTGSILFYPVTLVVGIFPWSLWLIPILMWANRAIRHNAAQRPMIVLAAAWCATYVGAFSLASTKLPSYITPCYPGVALIIGSYLCEFELKWSVPSVNWRRAAYTLTSFVGIGIVLAIAWLSRTEQMPQLVWVSLGGVALLLIPYGAGICERDKKLEWVPATLLAGAAAFQIALFGIGTSMADRYRNDIETLVDVKSQAPESPWLAIGGMEPSWVLYLNSQIQEVVESPADPESWQAVRDFLQRSPDGIVIVSGEANELLQSHMNSDLALTRIAESDRFLKSDSLSVYSALPAEKIAERFDFGEQELLR